MVGVFLILLWYGLGFLYMRCFLGCVIHYQLNKSAERKRRKGQSKKEWFLYSRFRDVLPRLAVIWYLILIPIHLLALVAYIILMLAGVPFEMSKWVALSAPIFDIAWILVNGIMFFDPKNGGVNKLDRWIKKKRGMKK